MQKTDDFLNYEDKQFKPSVFPKNLDGKVQCFSFWLISLIFVYLLVSMGYYTYHNINEIQEPYMIYGLMAFCLYPICYKHRMVYKNFYQTWFQTQTRQQENYLSYLKNFELSELSMVLKEKKGLTKESRKLILEYIQCVNIVLLLNEFMKQQTENDS